MRPLGENYPLGPGRSLEGLFNGVFPMGSGDETQSLIFARQALYKQPSPQPSKVLGFVLK